MLPSDYPHINSGSRPAGRGLWCGHVREVNPVNAWRRARQLARLSLGAYFVVALAWSVKMLATNAARRSHWIADVVVAGVLAFVTLVVFRRRTPAKVAQPSADGIEAASAVHEATEFARTNGLDCLIVVALQKPLARTGTKIVAIRFGDTSGRAFDAWIGQYRPSVGDLIIGPTFAGYGPHSGRSSVVYMGSKTSRAMCRTVDAKTLNAADSYWRNSKAMAMH